ncbi:hypothetical protein AGMMS49941_13150 [Deferribacterales bacterium]|nr:hypothetical protein AGMMS49941_13150 [Deferribacterales bacterium]
MLLEPFILANKTNDEGNEESVFQFAERRLGKYAAQNLISTLVGGIYAGNAHELSIRAAFPHLYELEKQYGSLVRGMLAKMFSAISSSDGCTRAQTHKHYELISSKRGMNGLVSALADKCSGVSLRYKTPIETISSVKSGGYTVTTPDGKQNFDMLAICCNANDMAAITSELSKEMSQQLSKIAFAPVFVCGMGFDELQLAHPLDAFGYLAAPKDGRIVLGTLFNSALFAGRAPEGKALVTVIAVGTRNRQAFSLSDEELQSTIYEQVKPALGVSGQPEFISSFRTEYALPQYDIWHNTTKTAVNNIAGALAGLYIGGNSFGGVSMSDCVLTSRNIADRIFFDIKCGTS